MNQASFDLSRRHMFSQMTAACLGANYFLQPGAFAEELSATPQIMEGPFYPDKLPLDTDNDLLIINDSITPAVGEITHLTGKVLNRKGEPIRNAFVEIWQVDNQGIYLHSGDNRMRDKRDTNFQGYGRFLTNAKGEYYFRTIKPVVYPGRTPHIHVAISQNGKRIYTTQMFIKDHALNAKDGIFNNIGNAATQESVLVAFNPMANSKIGELTAEFNVVLGKTFQEQPEEKISGGIGPAEQRNRSMRRPPPGK
jgi:protocatechuate 3,4-dioxygenase, beta subunit